MISLEFPLPQFRTKKRGEKQYIFDTIRKRWLLLTPEEWVRQNFVQYLLSVLHYPKNMVALEKEIVLNGLHKRFDIVVYDRDFNAWMLVECKAPHVSLSETVLQQALRYNLALPVQFLVITNGESTLGWRKEADKLHKLEKLPHWKG